MTINLLFATLGLRGLGHGLVLGGSCLGGLGLGLCDLCLGGLNLGL